MNNRHFNIFNGKLVGLISALLFLLSCGSNTNKYTDTPTSGEITICVDETFKPIIDSELSVFHLLYKGAKIHVKYQSEAKCFVDLMNDSCRLIIVTRKLGADEEEIFKKQKYFPVQTNIARDAIAVIVNNNNNDTLFTFKQLTQILKGEINEWKGISTKSSLSKIQIVFDNAGSSTLRYMKDSIIGSHQLSENIFAAKSNEEVIKYVQNNPNAIGFIGSNWCKDLSDSTNLSFTKKIKVVGINPVVKTEIDFPQPYQSYVFSGFYPLSRKIYSVSREARAGLGTGFVSFLSSDKGQRIILKGGLVPATMPIRIVKIKNTL